MSTGFIRGQSAQIMNIKNRMILTPTWTKSMTFSVRMYCTAIPLFALLMQPEKEFPEKIILKSENE